MGEETMEIDGGGEKRGCSSPFSPASARKKVPRLFIKEMVLRNFKSYAGEQRIGPFHKVILQFNLRICAVSVLVVRPTK
jgi:hypothetical protein